VPLFQGGKEDYLFLDLHVPAKALEKEAAKSPRFGLDLWGGGAYMFGSKDALQPIYCLFVSQ